MIASADLQAWLTSQGVDPNSAPTGAVANGAWSSDGYVPPTPDRLIVLTPGPGGPTQFERTFEVVSFQVLVRGLQDNPADAEGFALQVDDTLMNAVCPITIGPGRVIDLDYVGGPPRFFQRDVGRRSLFVCNYLFTVSRS